jgi:fructuronate reductase
VRLAYDTLAGLPATVERPQRSAPPPVGIVHFGPGAFHRAHQAAYIDRLLGDDPRWGIAAVSLRSRGTVDALAAQQGLYTLAIRDAEPSRRVMGAHGAFLGPAEANETLALLAAPATRLVTTTVTEKGYCLSPDGTLDMAHPDIVRDLTRELHPISVVGWIVAGLASRRASGTAPFVAMPCDNLADNGAKLKSALVAYARARDTGLADWIADEVRVPATMVDSITPASDDALIADVAQALGVRDAVPVQREAFAQWVIEDIGATGQPGPDLGAVGAIVTNDVAAFERAKLRILNGAHSTLAYAGLLRGRVSVAEAIGDAELAGFISAMIHEEVIPTLPPLPGLDLGAYAAAVLKRFANPAIIHRLDQIAQDGTQKLPYRLGDTLIARRRAGAGPGRVAAALGLWVAFVIGRSRAGVAIIDPLGTPLAEAAHDADPCTLVARLADRGIVFSPELARDEPVMASVVSAAGAALAGQWPEVIG